MYILKYSKLKKLEFWGLGTFQFLAYFRRLMIYTFLAIYLSEYIGLNTTELTLMATIPMIISASAQSFLWGPLLDRIRKPHLFVIWGEIVAGFLHIVMFWSHKWELDNGNIKLSGLIIILLLGIIELPWSASNVGWATLISDKTNNEERTRIMSQLLIIGGVGGILGARIGGELYKDGNGFANGELFYIASFIILLSALVIIMSIKDEIYIEKDNKEQNISVVEDSEKFNKKIISLFLISLIFINFGRNSISLITSIYLADDGSINASDSQVATYRNISSLSTMATGIILGIVVLKNRDHLLFIIGTIMTVSGLIWLSLSTNFDQILISAAILGSIEVIIYSSSYSIFASIVPEELKGRFFGYYNSTFFLSWGVGATFVTGPISDLLIVNGYTKGNAYRITFIIAAIFVLVGLAIFIYMNRLVRKYNLNLNS